MKKKESSKEFPNFKDTIWGRNVAEITLDNGKRISVSEINNQIIELANKTNLSEKEKIVFKYICCDILRTSTFLPGSVTGVENPYIVYEFFLLPWFFLDNLKRLEEMSRIFLQETKLSDIMSHSPFEIKVLFDFFVVELNTEKFSDIEKTKYKLWKMVDELGKFRVGSLNFTLIIKESKSSDNWII